MRSSVLVQNQSNKLFNMDEPSWFEPIDRKQLSALGERVDARLLSMEQ